MTTLEALSRSLHLDPEVYKKTARIFRDATDDNMQLSRRNVHLAMSRTALHEHDRKIIDLLFTQFDKMGDGTVDFFEFAISLTTLVETPSRAESLQLALEVYDMEDRSQLSKDDIRFILEFYPKLWSIFGDDRPDDQVVDAAVDSSFQMWEIAQIVWSTGIDERELEVAKQFVLSLDIEGKGFVPKNIIQKSLGLQVSTPPALTKRAIVVDEKDELDDNAELESTHAEHIPLAEERFGEWVENWRSAMQDPPDTNELSEEAMIKDDEMATCDNAEDLKPEEPVLFSVQKFWAKLSLSKEFSSVAPFFERAKAKNSNLGKLASTILNGIYTPNDTLYGMAQLNISSFIKNGEDKKELTIKLLSPANNETGSGNVSTTSTPRRERTPRSPRSLGNLIIKWTSMVPGSGDSIPPKGKDGTSEAKEVEKEEVGVKAEETQDESESVKEGEDEMPTEDLRRTYKFEIIHGELFQKPVQRSYCQYSFLGQTFQTNRDNKEIPSKNPMFSYSFVHHIENLDETVMDLLDREPMEIKVFIQDEDKLPDIDPPKLTPNVRSRWEMWASSDALEAGKDMTLQEYKQIREDEGVETEPAETEWLNFRLLMDGKFSQWLSDKIYEGVGDGYGCRNTPWYQKK